ncbi:MAG TPA: sugar isomerase domain-containing protein [Clostridiales bacterium]|nr:sugar isomerase domain-containing protein [Clostridiales bacterium]
MLMDSYFTEMKKVLEKIEVTQRETIIKVSEEIAERLSKGAAWNILDTGHMLMFEGVGRTGGMMALKPIKITCEIDNPVRHRPTPQKGAIGYDSVEGFADYVLGRSNVLSGDIIMIGSVSGYKYFPVDLALKANTMDCLTIAISSVEYSSRLTSQHPSGKRLYEACQYYLDNCTNYGDTLVEVEEIGQNMCPASGISASYIMWALQSTVVEKLINKGLKPSVYISNHMPNATQINNAAIENYTKSGY